MGGFAESRGLGLIIELFLKSSVVLGAAILCSGLLRRRSASLRHFLLSVFLVGLAILPAFSVFARGWHARWLPDWAAMRSGSEAGAEAAVIGTGPRTPDLRRGSGMDRAAPELQTSGAGAPQESTGHLRFRTVLASVLFTLWLAGLVLILARLAAGLSGVRRLTREAEALDDSVWKRLLHRFVSAVRLNRKVDIKAHPQVIVPLTWGFRRPVVIMPRGTEAWTEDARSSALFHELSHVKRGDFLVMLLVRLSLAVFWFNPLFWIAYKMLKNEQEKACDELVLRAGIRPSTYADNLLSFIRSFPLTRSPMAVFPGVLGMFGRSQLRERLLVILGQKMAFKEVHMKTKVAVSALAFLAVVFIGLARPQAASATPETGLVAPDVAVVVTAAAAQETPAQDAQKAPEKQKKEELKPAEPKKEEGQVKKEVKIIRRVQEPREEPVEITIIDGKTQKTIKLDGSVLIVKKGKDGKTIFLSPEGKKIAVIEGEGTRLEIKGGKMTVLDDEEALKPGEEPKVFTVIEDDEKISTVMGEDKKVSTIIIAPKPHLEIAKEVEEPEHITVKHVGKEGGETILTRRYVVEEPSVGIPVDEERLEKKLAETQAVLKKIDEQKLAESNLAAQQEALRELERSLQALQEELNKKEESLKTLKFMTEPKIHITHEHGEVPEVEEITPDEESRENIIKITRGKEASAIMLNMKLKENSRESYEKAVAKLKQGLPQGFKLEPKYVEESGMMIIKITGPRGTEEDWEKVQKLIKELNGELKK
jgi:beta-lactamase regulating signal transducer with metallopeptidase domain